MKKHFFTITLIFCSFLSNSQSLQEMKDKAAELAENKEYKKAIKLCESIIKEEPNNALNYFNKSSYEYWSQQYSESIKDATKGLEFDPNEQLLYLYRAMAELKLNQKTKACEDLVKSKELGEELYNENCKN